MTGPFGRAIGLGAALWLLATVAIRLAGQWVMRPEPTFLLADFLVGGAAMALLGPRLRLRISADPADADAAALGLILPGMLADAAAVALPPAVRISTPAAAARGLTLPVRRAEAAAALAFRHVYPNLSPALGNGFGALMLWYYGAAALAIALQARWGGGRDAGADDGRSRRDRRRDHDQGVARAP